jgi:hypothetical protein
MQMHSGTASWQCITRIRKFFASRGAYNEAANGAQNKRINADAGAFPASFKSTIKRYRTQISQEGGRHEILAA